VKLFVDGEVVDEFIGALPEARVRRWLAASLPSATRAAVDDAQTALEAGDGERASALMEEVLRDSPNDAAASALLARAIVFRDPERAAGLAHQAASTDSDYTDLAQAVRSIATLVERNHDSSRLPAGPARSSYVDGLKSLRDGDVDQALRCLVESVRLDRSYEDEVARRACVAIFNVLGQSHALTRKHRRALEMVLF
jgi:putative thioredoxin